MWILLVVFHLQTFAVIMESQADCLAAGQVNTEHWTLTGQQAKAICMRTVEV